MSKESDWGLKSRNPFLFRGPIPTKKEIKMEYEDLSQSLLIQRSYSYSLWPSGFLFSSRWCRNPFLFRGPIPTYELTHFIVYKRYVAIPSYSEVLFLRPIDRDDPDLVAVVSQSLLIQRSYSYLKYQRKLKKYGSQSLLIQRSYSYRRGGVSNRHLMSRRNPFLFRGPIPTRYNLWLPQPGESQSLLIQRSYSYGEKWRLKF